jgi:hypothetical protein
MLNQLVLAWLLELESCCHYLLQETDRFGIRQQRGRMREGATEAAMQYNGDSFWQSSPHLTHCLHARTSCFARFQAVPGNGNEKISKETGMRTWRAHRRKFLMSTTSEFCSSSCVIFVYHEKAAAVKSSYVTVFCIIFCLKNCIFWFKVQQLRR